MSDTSEFSFVVEKSSGETKSLEVIEEEQAAYTEPGPKAMFDPTMVYGLVAICSVFAMIGIGACVAVLVLGMRKKHATQVHAATEDKKVNESADPKITYMRTISPNKIQVSVSQQGTFKD